MKINFKDITLANFSFKDLEYGLVLLNDQLDTFEKEMKVLRKYGTRDYQIQRYRDEITSSIKQKIQLIEDELGERMLTGNDDGILERELLGGG